MKAIDKASTLAAITKAKASALSEMRIAASGGYIGAAIKGWSQGDPFDAGDQVGTVTVTSPTTTDISIATRTRSPSCIWRTIPWARRTAS